MVLLELQSVEVRTVVELTSLRKGSLISRSKAKEPEGVLIPIARS